MERDFLRALSARPHVHGAKILEKIPGAQNVESELIDQISFYFEGEPETIRALITDCFDSLGYEFVESRKPIPGRKPKNIFNGCFRKNGTTVRLTTSVHDDAGRQMVLIILATSAD